MNVLMKIRQFLGMDWGNGGALAGGVGAAELAGRGATGLTPIGFHAQAFVVDLPVCEPVDYGRLLIMLADLLADAVVDMTVLSRCGRVYFIRFTLLGVDDPVLPFVFGDYGYVYRHSYRVLVRMLTAFARDMGQGRVFWDYLAAKRQARYLVGVMGEQRVGLSELEYEFFVARLMAVIAQPQEWV